MRRDSRICINVIIQGGILISFTIMHEIVLTWNAIWIFNISLSAIRWLTWFQPEYTSRTVIILQLQCEFNLTHAYKCVVKFESPKVLNIWPCVLNISVLKLIQEKTWRAMKQLTFTARDIRLSCFYTQFTALMRAASYYQRSGRLLTISYNLVFRGPHYCSTKYLWM